MSLTAFHESIVVLGAIKNNMENDLRVIKRYIHDEDLKFSLHIKMLIDIDSFLHEWKKLNGFASEREKIRETLRIAAPAIKRIKSWSGIHSLRNTVLAHGFRDDGNKGKPTCLNQRYFSANVPTTYAEIMLLSEFAVYSIATLICRHRDEHLAALELMEKIESEPVRGIETMAQFNNEVATLQQHMFTIDPSLKKCFGI